MDEIGKEYQSPTCELGFSHPLSETPETLLQTLKAQRSATCKSQALRMEWTTVAGIPALPLTCCEILSQSLDPSDPSASSLMGMAMRR